ncbi:MAG: hypothetical protein JWM05_2026, partial [Acidimicrobiales bacterium]|nr:hypothetical protein [Acidimicrobiales bacterium]
MSIPTSHRCTRVVVASAAVALACALTIVGMGSAGAVATPIDLGTAASFAVLAGSTVTNTGPSVVSGSLGVSPGTAVTGFPPGLVTNGTIHSADETTATARADALTAFNAAAAESTSATISADLGGQSLDPGVYTGTTLGLTGPLTLNAHGDPNAVFVFQSAKTLITASSSSVLLVNGADACNVYWQIGSSATLGTDSSFVGTILAQASVTATTSAVINGRLFAHDGAVTLDSNTITAPVCAPPTTTTTALITTTTLPGTTSTTSTTLPITTTTLPGTTSTTTLPGTTTTTLPTTTTTPPSTVPGTTTAVPGTTTTTAVPGTTTTAVITPPTLTTTSTTRPLVTPPTVPGTTTTT